MAYSLKKMNLLYSSLALDYSTKIKLVVKIGSNAGKQRDYAWESANSSDLARLFSILCLVVNT